MENIVRKELKIASGFVHLYTCRLAGQKLLVSEYGMLLSADEIKKAKSYKAAADKSRYISAHVFLRKVLSRYTGTTPANIRFLVSHYYNRPLLSGGEVNFSLSYRGDWALLSVSNHTIGADLEQFKEINNIDEFALDFFSDKERLWLLETNEAEEKHRRFYELWTLKESYIKAISKGLSYPLQQFSVLRNNADVSMLEMPLGIEKDWIFQRLDIAPGYAAALCYSLTT